MVIPPKYNVNSEMLELISKIQAISIYLLSQNLPKQLEVNLKRMSLLKSSLFSARIEGNPLNLATIQSGEDERKLEIFNLISTYELIDKVRSGKISKSFILRLHKQVLKNLSPSAGHLRDESSAIFNQAGVPVYICPSPKKISLLLDNLLEYINSDSEKSSLITAFITHLVFEKIHPFLDGNGRVGRLLVSAILKVQGWNLAFSVPFEEYLDEHKTDYYHYLDVGLEKTNEYLTFMLEAYLSQLEKLKIEVEEGLENKLFLPPRQEEIYNLIKDHPILSFDMVRRRFLKVPERTLRYDLNKLVEKGLVEKTGETRGRYYRLKKL